MKKVELKKIIKELVYSELNLNDKPRLRDANIHPWIQRAIEELESDIQFYTNNPDKFNISEFQARLKSTMQTLQKVKNMHESTCSNPKLMESSIESLKQFGTKLYSVYGVENGEDVNTYVIAKSKEEAKKKVFLDRVISAKQIDPRELESEDIDELINGNGVYEFDRGR